MVNTAPAPIASPAVVIVCTILFSNIESLRKTPLNIAIEITAAGIEAETVKPISRPKYAFAAPNTIARMTPRMIAVAVNSGKDLDAETYGTNLLSFELFDNLATSYVKL
ncbi:hypothetical protein PSKAS_41990 [Peribacillus sp. N1]